MSNEPRFVFLLPGEITDSDLTIGELRAWIRDSREDMRWLREELVPAIKEFRGELASVRVRQGDLDRRVTVLEAQFAALEAAQKAKNEDE